MKKLILAFAVLILSSSQALAQADTRVKFPHGRTTVKLDGKVGDNLRKEDYVFYGRAGQQLKVHLTSPNQNARFSIFRTKYFVPYEGMEDPLNGTKEVSDWSGTLSEEGDYHIYVFPTKQGTDPFTLEVTLLPEKVTAAEDFEGLFEIQGKAPRGLEGFKGIAISTVNFTSKGAVPVKPSGNVRAGVVYKMAQIAINGENLSFETVSLRGVSYQFAGKLSIENTENPNDTSASASSLKGHLTKSLNGKKVAEAEVELESVEGVD